MRLLFKQRFLSWFDSYDIYDEEGRTAYTVEGKLSWGHRLEIYGPAGDHLGTVKEGSCAPSPDADYMIGAIDCTAEQKEQIRENAALV